MSTQPTATPVANAGKPQTGPQSLYISTGMYQGSDAPISPTTPATWETYRTIRRDPTVALTRAFCIAPVVAGAWSVQVDEGAPDELCDYLKFAILPLRDHICERGEADGIDYGWSPHEVIWRPKVWKGRSVLVPTLKPLLVDITQITVDRDTYERRGFYQEARNMTREVWLYPMHSLLISWRVEGTNWYGEPLLENVRTNIKWWNDCNDGAGRYDRKIAGTHWIVHYPAGSTDVEGVVTANYDVAKRLLHGLESSGSAVIPAEITATVSDLNAGGTASWKVELLEHAAKQASFIDRLKYLDARTVRGLLYPERAVLESEYGTKADAESHASLAAIIREQDHAHITRQVNDQLVKTALLLNFGEAASESVRLVAAPIADEAKSFLQKAFLALLAQPVAGDQISQGLDIDSMLDKLDIPHTEETMESLGEGEGGVEQTMKEKIGQLYQQATEQDKQAA